MTENEKIEEILQKTTIEFNRAVKGWSDSNLQKNGDDFKSLFRSYFSKYYKEMYGWQFFTNFVRKYDYQPLISRQHDCLLGITFCNPYNLSSSHHIVILNKIIEDFNFVDLKYLTNATITNTKISSTFGVDYDKLLNIKF